MKLLKKYAENTKGQNLAKSYLIKSIKKKKKRSD